MVDAVPAPASAPPPKPESKPAASGSAPSNDFQKEVDKKKAPAPSGPAPEPAKDTSKDSGAPSGSGSAPAPGGDNPKESDAAPSGGDTSILGIDALSVTHEDSGSDGTASGPDDSLDSSDGTDAGDGAETASGPAPAPSGGASEDDGGEDISIPGINALSIAREGSSSDGMASGPDDSLDSSNGTNGSDATGTGDDSQFSSMDVNQEALNIQGDELWGAVTQLKEGLSSIEASVNDGYELLSDPAKIPNLLDLKQGEDYSRFNIWFNPEYKLDENTREFHYYDKEGEIKKYVVNKNLGEDAFNAVVDMQDRIGTLREHDENGWRIWNSPTIRHNFGNSTLTHIKWGQEDKDKGIIRALFAENNTHGYANFHKNEFVVFDETLQPEAYDLVRQAINGNRRVNGIANGPSQQVEFALDDPQKGAQEFRDRYSALM